MISRHYRRRTVKIVIGAFVFLLTVITLYRTSFIRAYLVEDGNLWRPPLYKSMRQDTRDLPQHNLSLPFPEGANGRYVRFSNQARGLGWNNVQNELLMNAHLAYRANRAYVFDEYVWAGNHYPWSGAQLYMGTGELKTPLSALLSGPVVGQPWAPDVRAADPVTKLVLHPPPEGTASKADYAPPRSVSTEYWEIVCPEHKRRKIVSSDVKAWDRYNSWDMTGLQTFNVWLNVLTNTTEFDRLTSIPNDQAENHNCIEVVPAPHDVDGFPQIFDLWLWGFTRILDVWEEFKQSPISSTGISAGSVVKRGVQRNLHLFSRHLGSRLIPQSWTNSTDAAAERDLDPLGHTIALHLRRGDYHGACQGFADWTSSFYSWNQLDFLPDRFVVPPYPDDGREPGHNSEENVAEYMSHCWPDQDQIKRKVEAARKDWEEEMNKNSTDGRRRFLDTIFLLTTERDKNWLSVLRERLNESGHWKNIVISSVDVVYGDAQEKDVGMAIDMELARMAAVFVGNGFSSYTSNIVHRRLVDEKPYISCRFF